jgi:hypothetical protein
MWPALTRVQYGTARAALQRTSRPSPVPWVLRKPCSKWALERMSFTARARPMSCPRDLLRKIRSGERYTTFGQRTGLRNTRSARRTSGPGGPKALTVTSASTFSKPAAF